jgi:exopolysaccharide biosynthesis polyprenyl glycosylphosphotransferase
VSRLKELLFLLLSDVIFISLAYSIYYYFRVETGWIIYANPPSYLMPMCVINIYWIIVFAFAGLYQHWFVRSRFDEFSSVFKTVLLGCLILFFAIFLDDYMKEARVISRFLILIYASFMIFFVSLGRILIRGFQINMLKRGLGLLNTVIVGNGDKAHDLLDIIIKYPGLGYKFKGFIRLSSENKSNEDIGSIDDLKSLIQKEKIDTVLIASEHEAEDMLFEILNVCENENVTVKIMPKLYEIVSGMAKTQQIYGIPLIEVKSQLMSFPSRLIKRLFDIFISICFIIIFLPFLIIIALIIKLTTFGPVFYTQKCYGKNSKIFTSIKFRTTYKNTDYDPGAEWTKKNYTVFTPFGRFLKKTKLEVVPQFINVIKNNMSIVGPRPEPDYYVESLKKEISYYKRRFVVKPGITGWAQVKHNYDATVEDVKTKLQNDFYYIENMSLSLDFKIMLNTIFVVLTMKGN